jgi:hypothetical protein
MEAVCSAETPVYFRRTTAHCIPEDSTPHSQRCENLKSYTRNFNCASHLYAYLSSLRSNLRTFTEARNRRCFRGSATALHLAAAMASLPEHTPPVVAARAPSIHRGTAAGPSIANSHVCQLRNSPHTSSSCSSSSSSFHFVQCHAS